MKCKIILLAFMFFIIVWGSCEASPKLLLPNTFSSQAAYDVCFTPGDNCTDKIVAAINSAQQQVLMQAYSFTSFKIAKALVAAEKRGVAVRILVDKSELDPEHFSMFLKLYL